MVVGGPSALQPDSFTSFGELLRFLRRRARLTQRALGSAVGYTHSHISRLENGQRLPDEATLTALLVPALRLSARLDAPWVTRLGELAGHARRRVSPATEAPAAHEPTMARDPEKAAADRPTIIPRQLPYVVAQFVGRSAELDQLRDLAEQADAGIVVISAIGGMAGIGKTTLAVHAAHRLADRFPGGQLYVNLRGFDPSGAPVRPGDAVRGFLEALGVPPDRMPYSLDARSALYRSLVTGRRLLVVLDNALDAEQVRPLLPGQHGCLVLVTSRNPLTGLVGVEGAQPLTLQPLSADDAREIMARRLGTARARAERDAVDEIIDRCGYLPLALGIVAARAVTHPEIGLSALARELSAIDGLDAFAGEDARGDIRAVFSWSYERLSPAAATLFRMLARSPAPDIGAPAAASLVGADVETTRHALAELAAAHLVEEHVPGRFSGHDLLRAYAAELNHRLDSAGERREAVHRLLDHYLHTAYGAALLFNPQRHPLTVAACRPGVTVEPITDDREALAWFMAEHRAVLAAVELAADARFDVHAWQLPWTLANYLQRHGYWHDWVSTQHTALAAAIRADHLAGQAQAHQNLARAYTQLDRDEDTETHYRRSLAVFAQLDDWAGQGLAHLGLMWLAERRSRYAEAVEHAQHALAAYQQAGHRAGQARALNAIGWCSGKLGDHRSAAQHCRRALVIHREVGDRLGEGGAWDSIGYAHHELGQHGKAVRCYQRALDMFRELGVRYYEADTLGHLGDTYYAMGDHVAAGLAWQSALASLDNLAHPDAQEIRARLDTLADNTAVQPSPGAYVSAMA